MTTANTTQSVRIGLALVLVLAIAMVAGCGKKTAANVTAKPKLSVDTRTAKGAAILAMSSLPTSVANPKLLLCQTVAPIAATITPVWQFVIGSPKDNLTYSVLVNGGMAQKRKLGKVTMKPEEWAKIPSLKDWKIDSDIARTNALNVYPKGQNDPYMSSFVTYSSEAATQALAVPMTWVIDFDPTAPRTKKSAPSSVFVDMRTGAAALVK